MQQLKNCGAFVTNNFEFNYQNQPINPACVAMFNSSEADPPYIRAINLNVCQNSNAAFKKTLQNDGWYYFYNNDKDEQEGDYHYKVVGKTTNGIYVLHTLSSGGGTLIASDLLLIRLDKNMQYVYDGPQLKTEEITEMKLLGYIIGGDRCVGSFADAQIVGNYLKLKQNNDKTPDGDCKKQQEYSIDLSQLK
jgi:hypothetical protein